MKFYIQGQDDQYTEATNDQIEELFRERSDRIVSEKLAKRKDKYMAEVRAEAESKLRDELRPTIERELTDKFKSEIDELQAKLDKSETSLRRKTITAEYGLKPDAEEFLGNGTEEEMRAKADKLKDGFTTTAIPSVEKVTGNGSDSSTFVTLSK